MATAIDLQARNDFDQEAQIGVDLALLALFFDQVPGEGDAAHGESFGWHGRRGRPRARVECLTGKCREF